ncbi:MAG: hypothetical protein LC102_00970 [Ignavibacteriales bacterium]|nr:MAG: hypothetical protein F9K26_03310 [Ignavibacteriaceae bacterium]MBW7872462.1 hypothetical protein [Ignavibacteria bacterium]MCZ2141985.1 hypothetical protein [Ignavibacteriales bacterium]MBV6445151.1 hypothetical protein [Ignavibacteriaceae bacterium]MBZ0197584.1 hypothetical protein [Ignavibacteriaceae bacterium]
MELRTAGNYSLTVKMGNWGNFDYFEGAHVELGIKALIFISKTDCEPVPIDPLKSLRKRNINGVMKIYDIFFRYDRLVVVTEPAPRGAMFDYFYNLHATLDQITAIDLVLKILAPLQKLHAMNDAVGYMDESSVFFFQGDNVKIGGDWLIHYENLKAVSRFELAPEDLFEAKIRDIARCGSILFRLVNQETLRQNNPSYKKILQSNPVDIHPTLLEVIQKSVNLQTPRYENASEMIGELKAVKEILQSKGI